MMLQDFNYQILGRKGAPWLVFLHGLLGSAANWRRITPAFEENFQILTFDQRGHGKSFRPSEGYAPSDFAGDLKFLFDALGIPRASVVGHSMGGRNAMAFAHLYPQNVEKLVIEDIGPSGSLPGRDAGPMLGFVEGMGPEPQFQMSGPDVQSEEEGENGENGENQLISLLLKIPAPFKDRKSARDYFMNEFQDPKLGNFLMTNFVLNAGGQFIWGVNLQKIIEIIKQGRIYATWSVLQSLTCPILVLRGELSTDLPLERFEKMKTSNVHVQGVEIAGAGHLVHADRPDQFIEVLRNFLSK